MKNYLLVAVLGILAIPTLGYSQEEILVQTSSNEWDVDRNIVLTGSSANIGTQASGIGGTLSVDQYLGSADLTRVVIRVLQPAPGESPTIAASLTLNPSESTTFTSSTTGNRIQETSFAAADSALTDAIIAAGGSIDEYLRTKNGASYANQSLSSPDSLNTSVNITQSSLTLFDSDAFVFTPEQLNEIFRDGGALNFEYLATSTFNWNQTTTATITATLSGANTGQIVVEYYAVPEPTTALLFGASSMVVLFMRRRPRA
jgi:hypothetical protein